MILFVGINFIMSGYGAEDGGDKLLNYGVNLEEYYKCNLYIV